MKILKISNIKKQYEKSFYDVIDGLTPYYNKNGKLTSITKNEILLVSIKHETYEITIIVDFWKLFIDMNFDMEELIDLISKKYRINLGFYRASLVGKSDPVILWRESN